MNEIPSGARCDHRSSEITRTRKCVPMRKSERRPPLTLHTTQDGSPSPVRATAPSHPPRAASDILPSTLPTAHRPAASPNSFLRPLSDDSRSISTGFTQSPRQLRLAGKSMASRARYVKGTFHHSCYTSANKAAGIALHESRRRTG